METVRLPYAVPYYPQRVTEETAARMGFDDPQEGVSWSCRGCGIAALRMAVDALCGANACPTQGDVIRTGVSMGAYRPGVGWIHQGLVELAGKYGVRAETFRAAAPQQLAAWLREGRLCIVSVSPHFSGGERREDGTVQQKGGHLVALYGYETEDGALRSFLCHHTSCFPEYEWPDCTVPLDRFAASFTGNGIVFETRKERTKAMRNVDLTALTPEVLSVFGTNNALLTAGDRTRCNTMTIGWCGLGRMWNLPACTVYVRPSRYTYEFMERQDYFTVSVLPVSARDKMAFCGSKSGRDVDKFAACGLTVQYGAGDAPMIAEADWAVVCRKLYAQDLKPEHLLDTRPEKFYQGESWHRMYIGEVVELYQK
jgi:flavin reductase (DIM6/NTAB) family NADH-FMN oxidoreductase RutF